MIVAVVPTGKYIQHIMTEHLDLRRELSTDDLYHIVRGKTFIECLDGF